jgi:ABC-type sugar transport system ATPase subunit
MSEIRIVNLRKEYKDVVAVNNISTTFPSSTVTCLLGPSGCGKTTLLRMIAGLEKPTSGDIYFDQVRVTALSPSQRNIGMVFQYPVVYQGLTVYRNIELPLIEDQLSKTERRKRVEQVAEILDLKPSLDMYTAQLDNSTRQKVAVARAVARQPRIILFDEPITNVDVNSKVQLKRALRELTKQLSQTIIYVTHDQTEAMTLADQIALMQEGVIVQRDSPRELYNRPNDEFGGWFLGNPGMNFFDLDLEKVDGTQLLKSPLFPAPLIVAGIQESRIRLGIRPEYIRVSTEQTAVSVCAEVVRRSIVVGGQYLFVLKIDEQLFKAKAHADMGPRIQNQAWVELPLNQIALFGPHGHRLDASITRAKGQVIIH